MSQFTTSWPEIRQLMSQIRPIKYGHTRNFVDGAVTRLSPYISRGVLSTRQVFHYVRDQGHEYSRVEKLIQELAWRDYWQLCWNHYGSAIDDDLRHAQSPIVHQHTPRALVEGSTGVVAVDRSIHKLYETGYMHNHLRMYVASIACNFAHSHWRAPAKWMYYHLFDGDWASNALSWQWVAGTNSHKKYVANQDNINKYCHTDQRGTFLDRPYDQLILEKIPKVLQSTGELSLHTPLPQSKNPELDAKLPTALYSHYNLDPLWRQDDNMNRILLLEPQHFKQYPISEKVLNFILNLAKNIEGMQIVVGSFATVKNMLSDTEIYYKEHPFSRHWSGQMDPRDWMFSECGVHRSFFSFWKACQREVKLIWSQRKDTPSLFPLR